MINDLLIDDVVKVLHIIHLVISVGKTWTNDDLWYKDGLDVFGGILHF